jgi:hypothetical protein
MKADVNKLMTRGETAVDRADDADKQRPWSKEMDYKCSMFDGTCSGAWVEERKLCTGHIIQLDLAAQAIPQVVIVYESVDHPSHYGSGADDPYEHIKVADAWGLNYRLGNATKYICRAGRKPGADTLQDLKKALWYLESEIKRVEENERG